MKNKLQLAALILLFSIGFLFTLMESTLGLLLLSSASCGFFLINLKSKIHPQISLPKWVSNTTAYIVFFGLVVAYLFFKKSAEPQMIDALAYLKIALAVGIIQFAIIRVKKLFFNNKPAL